MVCDVEKVKCHYNIQRNQLVVNGVSDTHFIIYYKLIHSKHLKISYFSCKKAENTNKKE